MDSKQGLNGNVGGVAHRVYEDFEPHFEWARDESFDTLLVYLPGFPKDKLKIQITPSGKLKISGERLTAQNKWRRFLKELPLEPSCDANEISAKFEGGILYVKVPKPLNNPNPNTQAQHKEKPTTLADKKRAAPTVGDQNPNRKPPQKQEINSKADNAKEMPSLSSGSRKPEVVTATKPAEEEKAAAKPGGEGSGAPGDQNVLASKNVGLVRRTTSFLGEYRKAIATQGNPRVLANMLLAVLFVGVLALYAKNVLIRSLTKSNGSDHRDEL